MYYNNPYSYGTYQQQNYPQNLLNGRVVGSIEEAKAMTIPIDGTTCYFPCLAEGRIYTKSINRDGMAVFQTYELTQTPAQPTYAESNDLKALQERVLLLEQKLKGGADNVHSAD